MSNRGDPAEWNDASEVVDYAGACDTMEDRFREVIDSMWPGGKPSKGAREMVLGMIRRCLALTDDGGSRGDMEVVAKVLDVVTRPGNNPGLMAQALRFIFNLSPRSQTAIAVDFSVTRAAVSRTCVMLAEEFGIPPGRGMKSEEAREVYAERATLVHARKPPVEEEPEDTGWADVIGAAFDIPSVGDHEQHNHHQTREAA